MQRRIGLALGSLAVAIASPGAGAAAATGGAVVVIRGANVSVARPLTPERALDGQAEVEIVRVGAAPAPAPSPAPSEPEREVVVILVPVEDPGAMRLGAPVSWGAPWPWFGWRPGLPFPHPHRRDFWPAQNYFPQRFHPSAIHRGPVQSGLRTRSAYSRGAWNR